MALPLCLGLGVVALSHLELNELRLQGGPNTNVVRTLFFVQTFSCKVVCFPYFSNYTYSLVSNDWFYGGFKDGFLGLERPSFCSYGYEDFSIASTFVGETSWDDNHNQLNVVACRILSPVSGSGNAVGDCTLRLSLRYTAIWTIRNDAKSVGEIGTIDDLKKINLTSYDDGSSVIDFPGLRYEYTELDRAKRSCNPVKEDCEEG
ncbi:hypothetical protein BUALT_Bualt18G0051400 [Buddleja alternifolia]|uniref:DUF2921 domain-containing protein n=1 Tax=Buddleja alternifolia TaxID=168488 RepID=A0AAV6WDA6_9LAMI|nr:hypothetical protein BUALT_Bualt18G0051400 [Buddleja alternifolia]